MNLEPLPPKKNKPIQVYKWWVAQLYQDLVPLPISFVAPVSVTQPSEHIPFSHDIVIYDNVPPIPTYDEAQFDLDQSIAFHKGK